MPALPMSLRKAAATLTADEVLRLRGALLGGAITSVATGAIINKLLQAQLKSMPATPDKSYVNRLLAAAKLPKDMPVVKSPGIENAAYAEPYDADSEEFGNSQKARQMARRARSMGAIFYDPRFNRPGIMAHEIGHASIRHAPWYSLSRLNQSYLRPIGDILNVVGAPAAGVLTGAWTGNPLYGLGAGLGVGALTGLPTLINEYQASSRGKDFMSRAPRLPADIDSRNRNALDTAWLTYAAGATVPAMASGLLSGAMFSGRPLR